MNNDIQTPRRVSLRRWALHNGIGYGAAREFAARAIDPIPAVHLGRRILVDLQAAEEWLQRQHERVAGRSLSEIVDGVVEELMGGANENQA